MAELTCPNCGNVQHSDYTYCIACDKRMDGTDKFDKPNPLRKIKIGLVIIYSIKAILTVCLFGYLLVKGSLDDNSLYLLVAVSTAHILADIVCVYGFKKEKQWVPYISIAYQSIEIILNIIGGSGGAIVVNGLIIYYSYQYLKKLSLNSHSK